MLDGESFRSVARRVTRKPRTRKLGEAISDYLRASGLAAQLKHPELFAAWDKTVPEEFGAFTRVAGFRNRVVTIEVSSSAALQELAHFWRERLRKALVEQMKGLYIEDLRFVLRDFGRGNGSIGKLQR